MNPARCRQAVVDRAGKLAATAVIIGALALNLGIPGKLYAQDAGSRASYTRGGWVGAKYVGMGKAAEVVADDVFAIYWNPAGLPELKNLERLTPDEIREKVKKGDVKGISEEDLLKFSEDTKAKNFFHIGVSGGMLDIERETGFAGVAFNLFSGVAGAGVYSIQSRDITATDESGSITGSLDYTASVGFLSYGWSTGAAQVGFSVKGLQETIGKRTYYGGGVDFGTIVDVLPFLKLAFVLQDIGTGLYTDRHTATGTDKFDFAYPSMKLSASLASSQEFIFAVTLVKKLEQKDYQANAGLRYSLTKRFDLYLGMSDTSLSSGFSLKLLNMNVGYAFAIDNVNLGYNNIVSLTMVF
ncbi:MAG: hypothetical protein EPN93_17930 [Spirochaetes bacterium]|nr:MAG: hypothetical protein EPN93_17930 [Spirochaetota bacterium]